MKFYVVWKGRETGIFTDWNTCKKQIHKFKGASYKSFKTRSEAESALSSDKKLTGSNTSKLPTAKPTSKKEVIKTYTAEDISLIDVNTKIYTDGGCVPNPGEAGSGLAVYRNESLSELWYGLYNPKGTNNTAELNALHQALLMARDELSNGRTVAIFCDSQYSIQSITQWAVKWSKNGWKKKAGEIKNLEIIKEMFTVHQSIKDDVEVMHVNGHIGLEGNELADRMTMFAIEQAETDFSSYRDELDIQQILSMRTG